MSPSTQSDDVTHSNTLSDDDISLSIASAHDNTNDGKEGQVAPVKDVVPAGEAGSDADIRNGDGEKDVKDDVNKKLVPLAEMRDTDSTNNPALLDSQTTTSGPIRPSSSTHASNDHMESSAIMSKSGLGADEPASEIPAPLRDTYLDPTPVATMSFLAPSHSTSNTITIPSQTQIPLAQKSPTHSDAGFDDKGSASEDGREGTLESKSEIQNIMDQFEEHGNGPANEEDQERQMMAGTFLSGSVQHPPRKSSLEPLRPVVGDLAQSLEDMRLSSSPAMSTQSRRRSEFGPGTPQKPESIRSFNAARIPEDQHASLDTPLSPGVASLHRPPPPEPEPEPDLPFDFHRFLEQLRHRTADPVAKFLRSFLAEFGKKQWMVHEQVKIIGDFLAFITNKMAQCDVWREVSDAEFDNAREGMEKLVMNRLYTQTFSPAIPPPQPLPGARPRKKNAERLMGPGRKGQHQEDVERDDILAQKVSIYGWVKEEHLDIPPVEESGKRFLVLAQQELLKIKTYRAPRDKIICVLNCCKVIFGLLKQMKSDGSADAFMPLLIYVILQANPEHLVSNVQYILRFRNQDKLGGEAGYYINSLMGAVQFIENLDRTSLTIKDEAFEAHVEAAVSAIAEKHAALSPLSPTSPTANILAEKSTPSRPEVTARHSHDGESSAPRPSTSSHGGDESSYDTSDEKAAMTGLLRTIQRPLSSIGRIFSDEGPSSGPARTPLPGNSPRMSPAPSSSRPERSPHRAERESASRESGSRYRAEGAAARQASAEAEEARRGREVEFANVVETLAGMFPALDRDLIADVVRQKEGR